jgi:hypothetical protein
MLRFFRHVRQRLLSNNQLGKYLLYAVGEILLVVIGILLALQINTWSENRKREKLKASYTASLIGDLALDTLMIGRFLDENKRVMKSLEMQQQRILGPDTPIDTLMKVVMRDFEPELNTRLQYHRNTFNTLVASGNIDLFSREFNEKLMALISMQDLERENSNYYLDIYSGKVSRFSDSYPVSGRANSNMIRLIWANVDERELASGFISLTDIKSFAHLVFARDIAKIKEQTTQILEYLDSVP